MKFIFFVMTLSCFFVGCSHSIRNKVYNNLSEMVDFVVVGKNESISASLMCGRREVDYKSDGFSTQLIPYGILTVSCHDMVDKLDSVAYILFVGTIKFQGEMKRNPYDSTWVVDIKDVVDKEENIRLDVFVNEEKYSLKLSNTCEDWILSSNEVFDILIEQYKDDLKKMIVDGDFEGETYIKLINEDINYSNYYYYVSVVDRKGGSLNFLVSPKSKERNSSFVSNPSSIKSSGSIK